MASIELVSSGFMASIQVTFDFHLTFADAVGFVPVYLRLPNHAIFEQYRRRAFQLAPTPAPVLLLQELDVTHWSLFFPDLLLRAPSVGSSSTLPINQEISILALPRVKALRSLRRGESLAQEFHGLIPAVQAALELSIFNRCENLFEPRTR